MVNVTGDATAAVVVGKSEGQWDEDVYYDPNADVEARASSAEPTAPPAGAAG